MIGRFIGTLALGTLLAAGADASTVSVIAPDKVGEGNQFQIVIVGDFINSGLFAGGVQLLYDPSLIQIDDFTFNLNVDANFSCPGPDIDCPVDPPGTFSIAWGGFLFPLIPVGAGPTTMATITATALAPSAGAGLSLVDFSDFTGGWFDVTFAMISPPTFDDTTVSIVPDTDIDGVSDNVDNCTNMANADQRDTNADGIGNACDPDLNNDCAVDFFDVGILKQVFLTGDADADFDGNGTVDFFDVGTLKQFFLAAPGPSANATLCTGLTLAASDWGNYAQYGLPYSAFGYFVGNDIDLLGACTDCRSYFEFDLSGLPTGPVANATLRLYNPASGTFGDGEIFAVWDVQTSIGSLVDGTAGIPGHADLGSGVQYGEHETLAATDNDAWIEIPLNDDALAAINAVAGLGSIVFGGSITTLDPLGGLFAFPGEVTPELVLSSGL